MEFLPRKVSHGVAQIKLGMIKELPLGNLDAERDWGFAGDYVEAMYLMLQQDTPADYVVATAETHSVRRFCEIAFGNVGLNYADPETLNDKLIRPAPVDLLHRPPSHAEHVPGQHRPSRIQHLV